MKTAPSNILKDSELISDHRELLRKFMRTKTHFTISERKKVLRLYDQHIDKDNIRKYINRKIKVFFMALITDRLHKVKDYFDKNEEH